MNLCVTPKKVCACVAGWMSEIRQPVVVTCRPPLHIRVTSDNPPSLRSCLYIRLQIVQTRQAAPEYCGDIFREVVPGQAEPVSIDGLLAVDAPRHMETPCQLRHVAASLHGPALLRTVALARA